MRASKFLAVAILSLAFPLGGAAALALPVEAATFYPSNYWQYSVQGSASEPFTILGTSGVFTYNLTGTRLIWVVNPSPGSVTVVDSSVVRMVGTALGFPLAIDIHLNQTLASAGYPIEEAAGHGSLFLNLTALGYRASMVGSINATVISSNWTFPLSLGLTGTSRVRYDIHGTWVQNPFDWTDVVATTSMNSSYGITQVITLGEPASTLETLGVDRANVLSDQTQVGFLGAVLGPVAAPRTAQYYSPDAANFARTVAYDSQYRPVWVEDLVEFGVGPNPLAATVAVDHTEGTIPLALAFRAQVSGGREPYRIRWDFGDGTGAEDPNPTHVYTTPGLHHAVAAVTDGAGRTIRRGVDVLAMAPLGVTLSSPTAPEGSSLTVVFQASVTGGSGYYAYAWDFGDGATSHDANPTHTYPGPGSYHVTLTVDDYHGNLVSRAVDVTVAAGPGWAIPLPAATWIGVGTALVAVALASFVALRRRARWRGGGPPGP